jgi:hypothetical protein
MYVVMTRDESGFWTDAATVSVPAKSKRRTVLAKAFEVKPELVPGPGKSATFRVLPFDVAAGVTVKMEQPPPQMKLGR